MTLKEVKEGKKLIARFMGYPTTDGRVPPFNYSWNWMIPSLKKFREIISGMYVKDNETLFHLWELVMRSYKAFDIDNTFENFIFLLEFYNKEQEKKLLGKDTPCSPTMENVFSAMQGGTDGG